MTKRANFEGTGGEQERRYISTEETDLGHMVATGVAEVPYITLHVHTRKFKMLPSVYTAAFVMWL